jgi:hypothetical protein
VATTVKSAAGAAAEPGQSRALRRAEVRAPNWRQADAFGCEARPGRIGVDAALEDEKDGDGRRGTARRLTTIAAAAATPTTANAVSPRAKRKAARRLPVPSLCFGVRTVGVRGGAARSGSGSPSAGWSRWPACVGNCGHKWPSGRRQAAGADRATDKNHSQRRRNRPTGP